MGMDKYGCFMQMHVYYDWNLVNRAWRLDMLKVIDFYLCVY